MPTRPAGCLACHRVGDARADVAALGDVAGVAETAHQLGPGLCGAGQVPTDLDRLAREPVARQGRQNEMEGVRGVAPVGSRVGQRADRVDQLDHRARPAMDHDQRQRALVRRLDVDEVDVDAIDLGQELRQRIQARLHPPEVVLVQPVTGERLQRLQLDPL